MTRLFTIVERTADLWRLEIWTPHAPLGRCTHEGPVDRLIAVADQMASPREEVHILPRTASDWYGPAHRYALAPARATSRYR